MPRRNEVEVILSAKDRASRVISGIAPQITKLARLALGAAGLGALVIGAQRATAALIQMTKEAARVQGIERAFAGLAQSVGRSQGEMLRSLIAGSQGMIAQRDLMEKFNLAAQLVSVQFAQELPEAMGLLGKVAAATGQDLNFMLDSLVRGVGRVSPLILDNLGVQVSLTEATEKYAKELGVAADALNKTQQQAAVMALTMEKLRENTAAMPDPTGTLSFEMARLTAEFTNTRDALGKALLPAAGTFVQTVNDLAQSVLPGLVNFMQNTVGPGLSLLADKFNEVGQAATEAGGSFIDKFGERAKAAADRALRWGINIMVQFADGLIQGAVSALSAAMTFVGNLLSGWLKGGSPPKVAPELDQWGAEAMTEYLRGFTSADFDVLEGIQGPLQAVLTSLVGGGQLGQKAATALFKNLSQGLAASLDEFSKTGAFDPGIFDALREAGGEFGEQIEELARRQFKLAQATRDVQLAEEAVANARKQEEKAKETVGELADEFNRLKREGADKSVLEAKRREFLQAKAQLSTAKEQRQAAEDQRTEATKGLDPLKEQVSLQERLLAQLIDLSKVQAAAAEAATAAAAAAAGTGGIDFEKVDIPKPDFGDLDTAFDDAKKKLREKLLDLFAPVIEKWEGEWGPAIAGLQTQWVEFTGIVKEWWDTNVVPILDEIIKLIPPELIENLGKIAAQAILLGVAFGLLAGVIALVTSPLFLLGAAIIVLTGLWELHGEAVSETAHQLGVILIVKLNELSVALRETADELAVTTGQLGFIIEHGFDKVSVSANQLWLILKFSVLKVLTQIKDFIKGPLSTWFKNFKTDVLEPFTEGMTAGWEEVEKLLKWFKDTKTFIVDELIPGLGDLIAILAGDDGLKKWIIDLKDNAMAPLITTLETVRDWFNWVKEKVDALATAIRNLPGLPKAWTGGSPSPIEQSLMGVANAMDRLSGVSVPAFERQIQGLRSIGPAPGAGQVFNFNQTVNTRATQANVVRDWNLARALVGA